MKKALLFLILITAAMFIYSQDIIEVGSWEYGPTEAVAVKDSTAYISSGSYLWVLDISDESNPVLIEEIKFANYINFLEIVGNYMFITKNDSIIHIYDIHDSRNVFEANQIHGSDDHQYMGITSYQDKIYLGKRFDEAEVYDISDTVNIQYNRELSWSAQIIRYNDIGIGLTDDRINDALRTYDLTQSGNIYASGARGYNYDLRGIFIRYPYVYFGRGPQGIGTADVSDITSIKPFPDYSTGGHVYDVKQIDDTLMAVANGLNGFQIYDIDEDTLFTLVGECDVRGYPYQIVISGERAYIGARSGGLSIIDISDVGSPVVLGNYDGYTEMRGCDVVGNRLYAASGEGGLTIYDITDRSNPQFISKTYGRFIANDVKVDSIYAYLAEGDSGLTIMDISNEDSVDIISGLNTTYFSMQVDVSGDVCAIGRGNIDINSGLIGNFSEFKYLVELFFIIG